jgi:pSer/pThr/pTyr-binding forkhead associated (FHA) protein
MSKVVCYTGSILHIGPTMTHVNGQDSQQSGTGSEDQAEAGGQDQTVTSQVGGARDAADQVYGLKFILENGESTLFTSLPISIGRANSNNLVLTNETVSARHAQIYYDEKAKGICIVDLESLNGLFIEGQPTRRNVLYDGVKIGLGTAVVVFRDTGFIYSG